MGSDGDETSNVVLLEEAGFIDEEILMSIVIPLMLRTNSVFLTISTYGSAFDAWTRMTEKSDARGRPVFLVKSYTTVCEDCIEKGIADKCMHKTDMLPRWQGDDEAAKVKALMADDQQRWLAEAAGIKGTFDFIPSFSKYAVAFLARSIKRVQMYPKAPRMESARTRFLTNMHRVRAHGADIEAGAGGSRKRDRLGEGGDAEIAGAPSRKRLRIEGNERDELEGERGVSGKRSRADMGTSGALMPPPAKRMRSEGPVSAVVDGLAESHYEYCFIAIDPSGGGAGSNYSAISAVWERDGVVVVRARVFVLLLFRLSLYRLFFPPFALSTPPIHRLGGAARRLADPGRGSAARCRG